MTLQTLGTFSGADAYGFFCSPNEALGGLNPVEVLTGQPDSPATAVPAQVLLRGPATDRLTAVLAAARDYAADLGAW